MPRRVVRALRLGDSENLSDNYWTLHSVLNNRNFDIEKNVDVIYELLENELVFLYWELVHTRVYSPYVKKNIKIFKEYLIDEFMNRKYKRGRYKDNEKTNTNT